MARTVTRSVDERATSHSESFPFLRLNPEPTNGTTRTRVTTSVMHLILSEHGDVRLQV